LTLPEVIERYDDEHLTYLFALGLLDGMGDDNRRTARICASVNASVMNGLRLSGHGSGVKDTAYRDEDEYLPAYNKPLKRRVQSWSEMKANLGF
jgi:hypothetical protein